MIMKSNILLKIVLNCGLLTAFVVSGQTTVACSCDLTADVCDANCCCDTSCQQTDIDTFICSNATFNEDSSLCVNELVFVNNIPSTSVVNDNGVFCIIRQRDETLNFYTEPTLINSAAEFNAKVEEFPTFTYYVSSGSSSTNAEFYRSGETIDVQYSNGNWGKLFLPTKGIASSCIDGNPASYLNNQQSTCTRRISTSDCSSSTFLDPNTYFGFQVAQTPVSNFSAHSNFVNMTLCNSSATLLPITQASCNAATSVAYSISFDGISGIASACATITQTLVSSSTVVQSFSVDFISENTNTSQVQDTRSGNPGYIRGKPLRTATGDNRTLDTTIFALLSGDNRLCAGSSSSRINFGEDKITGCLQNFSSNTLCDVIQSNILSSLVTPPTSIAWYVAQFGNTAESATANWIGLNAWSVLDTESNTNTAEDECANLVVGLSYTVIYANNGSLSNPQAKITGVEVSPITKTIKYECYGVACNSEQFIEVLTAVTFIDASSAPAILLKQRPIVDARLPSDFFFPFTTN